MCVEVPNYTYIPATWQSSLAQKIKEELQMGRGTTQVHLDLQSSATQDVANMCSKYGEVT